VKDPEKSSETNGKDQGVGKKFAQRPAWTVEINADPNGDELLPVQSMNETI
jgi:hypothetical protein